MPKKKVRKEKFRMVKLLANIRFSFEEGGDVFGMGDVFEMPENLAKAEKDAGRVEYVKGVKSDSDES